MIRGTMNGRGNVSCEYTIGLWWTPTFLAEEFYVNVPLAKNYEAAFRGMPSVWKDVLENKPTT
jgi:hypothetical protein